jgi:hypothetical protein
MPGGPVIKAILLTCLLLLSASVASSECTVQAFQVNPSETTPFYIALADNTQGSTEANDNNWRPPQDMMAHSLSVVVDVAPGGAANDDSWVITLRDDTADTSLTCTITGLATSCTDVTHTPTIALGSEVAMKTDPSVGVSNPDAAAKIWISFCWSAPVA